MTATALLAGRVFRDPERRTSKTNKPFASLTIRVGDGDAAVWWKCVAFSESTIDELMKLGDGDSVAVTGSFKVEPYEKHGQQRLGFTVFADRVLSLLPVKRDRAAERRESAPAAKMAGAPFDDSVDGLFGGPDR
jgi:single-stranded DNA-binding protein